MDVETALRARRSVRGFLPREVPEEVLLRVFSVAQQAPSWCNIQPWRVWVTRGPATERLRRLWTDLATAGTDPSPALPWPRGYPEPYAALRRECGKSLYGAMGVARDDQQGRRAAWLRNYEVFDAPHVAMVCLHRDFDVYGALDVGCWLQSVLLMAISMGISTCAMASVSVYPAQTRTALGIDETLNPLVGLALGYEDGSVAANGARVGRAPVNDNIRFVNV